MNDGFVVEVRVPSGSAVYRHHLNRSQIVALCAAVAVVVGLVALVALRELLALHAAWANIARLAAQRAAQQRRLDAMERQAQTLQQLNLESERSIEKIERTLGARRAAITAPRPHAFSEHMPLDPDSVLGRRLGSLAVASARTRAQTAQLVGLAKHVLNLQRMAGIARSRMIAAIPSLNPVGGGINATFGWRTDPWPEFHKGLDLAAGYGAVVRAAADGVVASAGWEGGFGMKIDIDHENGYHTWYCHLARAAVSPGQHVVRGQPIAAVGTTGESTGPHLHYQVMHDGVAIDPTPFLAGVPPSVMASLPRISSVQ